MSEEPYDSWRERIERDGVPDPPVIFAGNWARKAIEDLEAEVERWKASHTSLLEDHRASLAEGARLREALRGIERTLGEALDV